MMAVSINHADSTAAASPGSEACSPAYLRALRAEVVSHRNEVFAVAFLDESGALIRCEGMFHGTAEAVRVNVVQVARAALRSGAAAIAVAHNHPFGCANPSEIDVRFTRRLMLVMTIAGIPLKDHLIVTHDRTHSMQKQGPWPLPLEEFAALMGYADGSDFPAIAAVDRNALHALPQGDTA